MKASVTHLKYFGVKDSVIHEEIYFIDKIEVDPLYIEFQFQHGESFRVRQSQLIDLKIEADPETLII